MRPRQRQAQSIRPRIRMKIYFSCSLTGGRTDEAAYGAIVDHLLAGGHDVLTAHLARPEVMDLEQVVEPGEVYQRDIEWIRECEALVAEVSTPSHGVGYEIAYALERAKPVLCCARRGARVSKMLTGNSAPGFRLIIYREPQEALQAVDAFLASVERG
jgi:2'-deoxynucleoside 5'-phosphate N-hydrolase